MEKCSVVENGENDLCTIQEAGVGNAFNTLPEVEEMTDVKIDGKDFRELIHSLTINFAPC